MDVRIHVFGTDDNVHAFVNKLTDRFVDSKISVYFDSLNLGNEIAVFISLQEDV